MAGLCRRSWFDSGPGPIWSEGTYAGLMHNALVGGALCCSFACGCQLLGLQNPTKKKKKKKTVQETMSQSCRKSAFGASRIIVAQTSPVHRSLGALGVLWKSGLRMTCDLLCPGVQLRLYAVLALPAERWLWFPRRAKTSCSRFHDVHMLASLAFGPPQ